MASPVSRNHGRLQSGGLGPRGLEVLAGGRSYARSLARGPLLAPLSTAAPAGRGTAGVPRGGKVGRPPAAPAGVAPGSRSRAEAGSAHRGAPPSRASTRAWGPAGLRSVSAVAANARSLTRGPLLAPLQPRRPQGEGLPACALWWVRTASRVRGPSPPQTTRARSPGRSTRSRARRKRGCPSRARRSRRQTRRTACGAYPRPRWPGSSRP